MATHNPDTDHLLDRAASGDQSAAHELLTRFRPRLRNMVGVRLDQRLSARVDPSDVVQEALAEAFEKLPAYLQDRPISFYPWLRRIAWERLVKLHRLHIAADRRTVCRENRDVLPLPDESAAQLVERFAAPTSEPPDRAIRAELRQRVRAAMDQLSESDRDLLAMRYLEQLAIKEIAEFLRLPPATVRMRHLRALNKLEGLLDHDEP
jgi:RNA polymerase sigma-70 factor (ECF subfamily)